MPARLSKPTRRPRGGHERRDSPRIGYGRRTPDPTNFRSHPTLATSDHGTYLATLKLTQGAAKFAASFRLRVFCAGERLNSGILETT